VHAPLSKGKSTLRIRVRNDFGVSVASSLPPLGSSSRGLRVISDSWSALHDILTLDVTGVARTEYELTIWNPGQIASVDAAELQNGKLTVRIPPSGTEAYPREKILIHFRGSTTRRH
jgi:hypothetical protein